MTDYPYTAQHSALTSNMQDDFCTCDEFKKALEDGIDNEGYMAAIIPNDEDKNKFEIGCLDAPINFCPWCGKKAQCPSPS